MNRPFQHVRLIIVLLTTSLTMVTANTSAQPIPIQPSSDRSSIDGPPLDLQHSIDGATVTLRVERQQIGVIDPFSLDITVIFGRQSLATIQNSTIANWKIELPDGSFELIDQTVRPIDQRGVQATLTLQALSTGILPLGPFSLVTENSSEHMGIPAAAIRVESVLPSDHDPSDFRDLKPELPNRPSAAFLGSWIVTGGIAALLAGGAFLAYRLSRRTGASPSTALFQKQLEAIQSKMDANQLPLHEVTQQTMDCLTAWLATEVGDQVYWQSSDQTVDSLLGVARSGSSGSATLNPVTSNPWNETSISHLRKTLQLGDQLRFSKRMSSDRQQVYAFIEQAKHLMDQSQEQSR